MGRERIRTIYLLPHSHTDIGYTHDPLLTWELHDRFLDQAISFCEQTAKSSREVEPFRWTIEVFAPLEHWLEHRGVAWHHRLQRCLEQNQIAFGARRFHGSFLYTPADIAWEVDRLAQLCQRLQLSPTQLAAVQNDVNGFPLAFAEALSRVGVSTLLMGLNTTMGASPLPRPDAFVWRLPSGGSMLVYNGWIYNRLRRFFRLGELGTALPGKLDALLEHVPANYPLDFLIMSATANDNVGPFESLSEQVALFNRADTGITVKLATISQVSEELHKHAAKLVERHGDWMDCWSFGAGSMPQTIAAARKAQRQLESVQAIRSAGWANVIGGSMTMDRARASLSLVCEHTYSSHSSSSMAGKADVLRQQAQCDIHAWTAETVATTLLRDHLTHVATQQGSDGTSLEQPAGLLVNPATHALPVRMVCDPWGYRQFASGQRIEHLLQFDREPTRDAFENSAALHAQIEELPTQSIKRMPLTQDWKGKATQVELPMNEWITLEDSLLRAQIDPARSGLAQLTTPGDGASWVRDGASVASSASMLTGAPVLERLVSPNSFMDIKRAGARDPSDEPWAESLQYERTVTGRTKQVLRRIDHRGQSIILERSDSFVRRVSYRMDPLWPGVLQIDADLWLSDDCSRKSLYLPLNLRLPGCGPVSYLYDSCGTWWDAREQIGGQGTSHYEAYRGVAVTRGGATIYLIARDTPLWQLGSFNFSEPWRGLHDDDENPFVAAWLYNNYWHVNFPAMSPGWFTARFLVLPTLKPFDADVADRLYQNFSTDDWHHPLDPNQGRRAD